MLEKRALALMFPVAAHGLFEDDELGRSATDLLWGTLAKRMHTNMKLMFAEISLLHTHPTCAS